MESLNIVLEGCKYPPMNNLFYDILGISKAMGYKNSGNLRNDIKQVKKIRQNLARAVLDINELSDNPQGFYEDEKSKKELLRICSSIEGFYDEIWNMESRLIFGQI